MYFRAITTADPEPVLAHCRFVYSFDNILQGARMHQIDDEPDLRNAELFLSKFEVYSTAKKRENLLLLKCLNI